MTPTIPVAEMPYAKHLKVSFFLPPGILLKNGNCYVEIKKKANSNRGRNCAMYQQKEPSYQI